MRIFLILFVIVMSSLSAQDRLTTLDVPPKQDPPLPWAKAAKEHLPPGEPGKDYTPAVVPNGKTASYKVVDGVKVFHFISEPVEWNFAENLKVTAWGINGSTPGPMIEVAEGDRVRIYVTNKLPAKTTIHWHGVLLPCGMDGVGGLTQPGINPGETYVYEFIFPSAGTFMYHSHFDSMTQEGMGLIGMIIVHKRESDVSKRPDRDFVILLNEWGVQAGTARPAPFDMGNFNILTMNGKVMPDTEPLVAKVGQRVWIRFGNLSAMDHHPIHLHGYSFKVIGSDGGWVKDPDSTLPETTVLVPVGASRVIELVANNPGDWIMHCHMTHHTMNQMGHGIPNVIGVDTKDLDDKIRKLIPNYSTHGTTGMKDMAKMGVPIPLNSIPMLGYDKQFGKTVLGGMATVFKVRERLDSYNDPGPYDFPKGTGTRPATKEELKRDGIIVNAPD